MFAVTIPQGANEYIEALILDDSLATLTGKTDILVWIRRQSDGLTYDWNDSTFKAYGSCTTPRQTMTEVDATNYPGQYRRAWTAPSADDVYEVTVDQSPGTDAANVPQIGEIRVGGWIDDIDAAISSRAAPGDAMDLVAGAVDAAAIATDAIDADAIAADAIGSSELATSAVNEIRDAILADSTPFNGANIDAAVSSRAAPGDAMALTAAALVALADEVWDEDVVGAHGGASAAGLLLRVLGAAISTRTNNPTLNALLGIPDSAGEDVATAVDTELTAQHGSGAWTSGIPLTQQEVRDAMKLAPTGGVPAAGSVDEHLDTIETDTADMQPKLGTPAADISADIAAVQADTDDIQTRLPAALVGGRMDSDVGNMQANVITAAAINAAAITAAKFAANALDANALAISFLAELADYLETSGTNPHGTGVWDATAAISQQDVRDAMKLAPTPGAPAAGSVDEHLDDILADTSAMDARLPADPADESVQLAAHATTQAAIAGLNDLDSQEVRDAMKLAPTGGAPAAGSVDDRLDNIIVDTSAIDTRLPADPADESLQQAAHAATQAAITALNDLDQADVQAAMDAQGYTAGRGTNLDKLDAAITTRSSHDAADVDTQLSGTHGAGNWEGGAGLTGQDIRDAMKLAPSPGAPVVGSVDQHLDDIETAAQAVDTRLPTDPADESNQLAQHAATQAAIASLNDIDQAAVQAAMTAQGYTSGRAAALDATNAAAVAVDARLPADPADESNLQAQHAATQAAIAALENLSQADVQAALTAHGYTSVRAALLDNLDAAISGLVTDVASVQTDTTELLARLTLARAAALDSIAGISTNAELLRKIQTNRLELAEGDPGVWILYDDNDVDTLLTWQVRDKNGQEIRMDSFVPARRTKAV